MIAQIYCPPERALGTRRPTIFLAGTIDDGNSVDWQQDICKKFGHFAVNFFNPRRSDWVANAGPDLIREQIRWELESMQKADSILFYFAPGSKSPVTMLELGLWVQTDRVSVCCPEGFWRRDNVHETCEHYGKVVFNDLDEAMALAIIIAVQQRSSGF